jgi:hypothetical protein
MDITPEILAQTGDMLKKHLEDYHNDIDTAFSNFEEDLTVNLKAKIVVEKGQIKIQTGINFPVEKVQDAETKYFDPNQRELFEEEGEDSEG